MPTTYSERNVDTEEFFPTTTPFPKVTTDNYLGQAATDILAILQEPQKSIPSLQYGSQTTNAYIQLAQTLKCATSQPIAPREPKVAQISTQNLITPPRVIPPGPAPTPLPKPPPARSNKLPRLPSTPRPHKAHQYTNSNQRRPLIHHTSLGRLRPTRSRLKQLVN